LNYRSTIFSYPFTSTLQIATSIEALLLYHIA
jgi:hypothetical protein